MIVELWLDKNSQSIVLDAVSTYQKGDLFCVKLTKDKTVYKYPIANIFCIKETNFVLSHPQGEPGAFTKVIE